MPNVLRICVVIALAMLQGCAVYRMLPTNWTRPEGRYWCNERYLDMVKEYQEPLAKSLVDRLQLAKAGYIYAVASALSLQGEEPEEVFDFDRPVELTQLGLERDLSSGFQAVTYLYTPKDPARAPEVVIAFRGSDQIRDYLLHNFWIWPIQLTDAIKYVKDTAADPRVKGKRIVVTGYSLGGGLAAYVTKDTQTSALISQAWAFNPSPRELEAGTDPRIYLVSTKYEVLNELDRSRIGALPEHTDMSFQLLKSSSIYSHYRWVLARQMLIYADFADYVASGRKDTTTEPLSILSSQSNEFCAPDTHAEIVSSRKRYEADRMLIKFEDNTTTDAALQN